ncbi:MAG TPA: amidohydrolase family protein, partial [Dehalococcoidia bacterium]
MTATIFHNARVLTMDPAHPRAAAVFVRDGLIVRVSDHAASLRRDAPGADEIDCADAVLAPAFIDAHCHLLATAARTLSIDCSPAAVQSIGDIQRRLREAASAAQDGEWLRAAGYDESQLAEQRHPTRRDLDAAVPHHPVRLLHRSGHALVLNTAALRLAGITTESAEPPGAAIDRFTDDGSPSGLLFEMNEVVDAVVPRLPYEALAPAVVETARRFLATGVTAICDATHTNGREEWELFARLQADGHLPLDVTLMEGVDHVGAMPDPEPPEGRDAAHGVGETASSHARLLRGHVKIMLHELGDTLAPDERRLSEIVRDLHARDRDVAIHAVEPRAVAAAVDAVAAAVAAHPR